MAARALGQGLDAMGLALDTFCANRGVYRPSLKVSRIGKGSRAIG